MPFCVSPLLPTVAVIVVLLDLIVAVRVDAFHVTLPLGTTSSENARKGMYVVEFTIRALPLVTACPFTVTRTAVAAEAGSVQKIESSAAVRRMLIAFFVAFLLKIFLV